MVGSIHIFILIAKVLILLSISSRKQICTFNINAYECMDDITNFQANAASCHCCGMTQYSGLDV